jgi:hypothetical protein
LVVADVSKQPLELAIQPVRCIEEVLRCNKFDQARNGYARMGAASENKTDRGVW